MGETEKTSYAITSELRKFLQGPFKKNIVFACLMSCISEIADITPRGRCRADQAGGKDLAYMLEADPTPLPGPACPPRGQPSPTPFRSTSVRASLPFPGSAGPRSGPADPEHMFTAHL